MSLGRRIRILRKSKDLTQAELGKILKLGKSTISQYENNINIPDLETLKKISTTFDVSIDYLVGNNYRKDINYHLQTKIEDIGLEGPEIYNYCNELLSRKELLLLLKESIKLNPEMVKKIIEIIKILSPTENDEIT